MDGRMLGGPGTGVTTYARALRAAMPLVGAERLILNDQPSLTAPPPAARGRGRRWLAALSTRPRRARPAGVAEQGGEGLLVARDLFRIAQVHFDLHGKLLTVEAPGPPGIMHWTYPVPLRMADWANIYTVHDAIPLTRPDLTPINAGRHRRLLGRIAESAAALATVSAAARDEIVGALGCPGDLVVDCSEAVEVAVPSERLPAGLTPGGYLIVCGSIEPRKNIARILDGYRASGVSLPLVLAGPNSWRAAEFAADIAATAGVVRLTDVGREEMLALIAGARALLMPSLAEGFGLPVVEAMALGTPVVTSSSGALAETAGGAALLVDPEDVDDIAGAIRRIAADDALARALVAAGEQRAGCFSAKRFASRLAELYARVIAVPG